MDTYGNSIANTCLQTKLYGKVVLVRFRTNSSSTWWSVMCCKKQIKQSHLMMCFVSF